MDRRNADRSPHGLYTQNEEAVSRALVHALPQYPTMKWAFSRSKKGYSGVGVLLKVRALKWHYKCLGSTM